MKFVKKLSLSLFIIVLVHIFFFEDYYLFAQNSSSSDSYKFWISVGLGPVGGDNILFGGVLGLSFSKGVNLISIRAINFAEISRREPCRDGSSEKLKKATDISFLYGVNKNCKWSFASVAIGLSTIRGTQKKQYSNPNRSTYKNFSTIGIPIETQLFLKLLPGMGIGIYGFLNINNKSSFGGIFLSLQYGKLR